MLPPRPPAPLPWTAVVLAGGTSRRWGGRDKTALTLAGSPMLLHAVASLLPGPSALAVVAPPEHPARTTVEALAADAGCALVWTREEPAGAGPVAGLAAGVAALTRLPNRPADDAIAGRSAVAVLAGDLPFTRPVWPRLLAALADDPGADAALGVDPGGHRQPLLAVYAAAVLAERLAAGPLIDQPLRVVTAGLAVVEVPVTSVEALDLDTPDDAAAARGVLTGGVIG